MIILFLL